jgi:hypothetical protein
MSKFHIWMLIIVALIAIGPLLTIWALNVLFPSLAIPYSLETWAAVMILGGVFKSTAKVDK